MSNPLKRRNVEGSPESSGGPGLFRVARDD